MKVLLRASGAFAALLVVLLAPAVASAATGSYTVSNWSHPSIYNTRFWINGATLSPPAGIPADAVVTSVSGMFTWYQAAPYGMNYEGRLCDYNTQACVPFGGSAYPSLPNNWSATTTAYAGKPAATWKLFFAAQVNDYSSSSIHPAINPPRYMTSRSITVNYEYTPAP
jgi:hypothetical protein